MADEDPFGSYFKSFLESIKPGSRVFPLMRYRQGGDKSNFAAAGGTSYLPGEWEITMGCAKWTGAATTGPATKDVTLPIEYREGFLVFTQVVATTPVFEELITVQTPLSSNSLFEFIWESQNNLTKVIFNWLAFGEIKL